MAASRRDLGAVTDGDPVTDLAGVRGLPHCDYDR